MLKPSWLHVVKGWGAGLAVAAAFFLLFTSGMLGIDLYSGDMALISLVGILGMMAMLIAANWFWCKIPLPLRVCKALGAVLLIFFPLLLLPHPEIGWKSLLLFTELKDTGIRVKVLPGHLVMFAYAIGAIFVYHLAPWFTRRFFFEHLAD